MKNKLWVIAILTAFTLSTTPCFAQGGGDKTTTSPAGAETTTSPAVTETTSPTGIVMVSIPAGTFTMGSPAGEKTVPYGFSETQHSVTLSGFKMSKYQVTQEQYQAVMGSNPSNYKSNPQAGETQDKRPVEKVSWYDAIVFCNRLSIKEGLSPAYSIRGNTDPAAWGNVPTHLQDAAWDAVKIIEGSNGYRLPTEAQWEYACRAGTTTAYNTGNTISDDTGWYFSNSGNKTHEVGLKPANAWGLHDMHGNIMEWCWDWADEYLSEAQTNPMGPSSGSYRVLRNGRFNFYAEDLRSAVRNVDIPQNRDSIGQGFRLVRP